MKGVSRSSVVQVVAFVATLAIMWVYEELYVGNGAD